MKRDIYDTITNQIIAQLEKGVRPWNKPWQEGALHRPLRANGEPYRGINVVVLWTEAMCKGYTSRTWLTYKQALELGGNVRKGEKATTVVYASSFTPRDAEGGEGEDSVRRIPFLKAYAVFNTDQCDNLPDKFKLSPLPNPAPIPHADAFFKSAGARLNPTGDRAYYAPSTDMIVMPPLATFRDAQSYYATLGHEHIHWTGAKHRLDRGLRTSRFGDSAYAFEELVAELGSAFLCAELEISAEPRDDHASYIANWLDILAADKRAIFTAASKAEQAVAFLKSLSDKKEQVA